MTLLVIEVTPTADLSSEARAELLALCRSAYGEDLARYFADVGKGVHLLGRFGGRLVSHAMWVERSLYPEGHAPVRSACVELVATAPEARGRRFASRVMERLAHEIERRGFDLGVLSPAQEAIYARLGWERWRGPLRVRTGEETVDTPDEAVMVLRMPGTPPDLDLDGALAVDWRPGEVW